MLFNKPSNSTTGFLLQTMLYVANITKHDVNMPRTREEFLLTPMGADSGSSQFFWRIYKLFFYRAEPIIQFPLKMKIYQIVLLTHKEWRLNAFNWINFLKNKKKQL